MGNLLNFYRSTPPANNLTNDLDPQIKIKASDGVGDTVYFGAGCYWGTEKYIRKEFSEKYIGSILETSVGFMGPPGSKINPNYREVCSGTTGHVEVCYVKFKGDEKLFEEMIKFFYQFHDPTTLNQQGNDKGSQYSSVIYCENKKQMEISKKVTDELQSRLDTGKHTFYSSNKITTLITLSTIYYPAHEEHQAYLEKNPRGYCNHRIRFSQWADLY